MTPRSTPITWYPLDALSKEWMRSGRRLSQPSASRCMVNGCYSMAFVALRTGAGNRMVCFRHYRQLEHSGVVSL